MGVTKTFAILLVLFAGNAFAKEKETYFDAEKAYKLAGEAIKVAKQKKNPDGSNIDVSVTVIDANGAILATLKTDGAAARGPRISFKKAFTALTTKANTAVIVDKVSGSGYADWEKFVVSNLDNHENLVFLKGGMIITDGEKIVGAIGVGGAKGGYIDDEIAVEAFKRVGLTNG